MAERPTAIIPPKPIMVEVTCSLCPDFSVLKKVWTMDQVRETYGTVLMAHNILMHGFMRPSCKDA